MEPNAEQIKRVKSETPAIVLFWKPSLANGWLSNWSDHPIRHDSITFNTMEHFIMYRKALLMHDQDSANKVLSAKSPFEAKAIGRGVSPWNEKWWVSHREDILLEGLQVKVKQHPLLKQRLLETGDRLIAEASMFDQIWGIGLSTMDKRAMDPEKWEGLNLLGKSWMRVRESFKTKTLINKQL